MVPSTLTKSTWSAFGGAKLAERHAKPSIISPQPAAFAADATTQPRLVLTDLQMPGLDGVALLRRMRADPRTRTVPVVVLSSSREARDGAAGRRAGANGYVLKPVDYADYSETLAKLGRYWLEVNIVPGQGEAPGARTLDP